MSAHSCNPRYNLISLHELNNHPVYQPPLEWLDEDIIPIPKDPTQVPMDFEIVLDDTVKQRRDEFEKRFIINLNRIRGIKKKALEVREKYQLTFCIYNDYSKKKEICDLIPLKVSNRIIKENIGKHYDFDVEFNKALQYYRLRKDPNIDLATFAILFGNYRL